MSSLVLLVRHGQASFGKADYDELSPLGIRQSELLGDALRERGWRFDRIVRGAMRRHRQTADALASRLQSPPAIEIDPDWDEFDHDAVVRAAHPEFPDQAHLVNSLAGTQDPRHAFQRIFVAATARWQSGQHDDYPESFAAFGDRCIAAAQRLASGGRTLVITSGGPIALLSAGSLTGDSGPWSRLNEVTVNTSVTKVLVSGDLDTRAPSPPATGSASTATRPAHAVRLLAFNDHAHLEWDRSLITYR